MNYLPYEAEKQRYRPIGLPGIDYPFELKDLYFYKAEKAVRLSVCLSVRLTVCSAHIPFEFTHFSCQLLHVSERFLCPLKRSSSVSNIVFF